MALRHLYALALPILCAPMGCFTYSESLLVASDATGDPPRDAASTRDAKPTWTTDSEAPAQGAAEADPNVEEPTPNAPDADARNDQEATMIDGVARPDAAEGGSVTRDATADRFTAPDPSGDASAGVVADGAADAGADAPSPRPDATPPDAGCARGNAIQLNGSTYATLNRAVQDDFTIEAWMTMGRSLTGMYFWQGSVIVSADVSTNGNDFMLSVLNDKLCLNVGSPDRTAISTTSVAVSKWVHVAATRTMADGAIKVYVDGASQGSFTGNSNSLSASTVMQIGGAAAGGGFVGQLDELRIWRVVRTPAEIVANMNRRLSGTETGLVGYYRFDEANGSTATDSSPSASHAAFQGPVTWVPSGAPLCD